VADGQTLQTEDNGDRALDEEVKDVSQVDCGRAPEEQETPASTSQNDSDDNGGEEVMMARRSARLNKGKPPARYGM
jgi:hypothetical protein